MAAHPAMHLSIPPRSPVTYRNGFRLAADVSPDDDSEPSGRCPAARGARARHLAVYPSSDLHLRFMLCSVCAGSSRASVILSRISRHVSQVPGTCSRRIGATQAPCNVFSLVSSAALGGRPRERSGGAVGGCRAA